MFFRLLFILSIALLTTQILSAADAPVIKKPVLKIIPGKVIVPTDAMRRPWGELVSVDLKTRTGTFRKEGTDEVLGFIVMPYAELLHHAANGDLQDFRIGERALFRLHENDKGEWTWLTYIQDEMNMMFNHKEYFYVDSIDAAKGRLTCTWANVDQSFVREKGVVIETDGESRYWRAGQAAQFADIKIGDKFRTKTHGIGKGKTRMSWEVFLDDESLVKFQTEQRAVHSRRMLEEGLPGYVDKSEGGTVNITLFREGSEFVPKLKAGQKVRIAPAGVDRKPASAPIDGTISAIKGMEASVMVAVESNGLFQPTGLVRLWFKN